MAQSFVAYTGNGSLTTYTVPFEYIDKSHVKVYLAGVVTTSFTWPSSGQLSFAVAPTNGTTILIRRETPSSSLVDFTSRAHWQTGEMNTATKQSLFKAVEAIDEATKFTTGAGVPAVLVTDNEGDTYLNTTNSDVYTRGASAWTLVGNIEGVVGPTGATGPTGPIGVGMPVGGTAGLLLTKTSSTDYDFAWTAPPNAGDMFKSTYDTNNDGTVDAAATAPWSGISGKPSTFAPSAHVHDVTDITGVTATAVELNYTSGVTSAIQTQLNANAALASPALTGVPTAPTASVATNTTQIATTEFVLANAGATGIQTFTATGSIAAGNGVSLKSDGTVCKIEKTTSILDKSYDMTSVSDATLPNHYPTSGVNYADNTGVFPLSNTTFLSVVRQNGGTFAMYARIITIAADGTPTFGSNTVIPIPTSYMIDTVVQVAPDKAVMFYDIDSNSTYAIVIQVTGSTITFGSGINFQAGQYQIATACASTTGKIIIAYQGTSGEGYPSYIQALSVSGTTISAGARVTIKSGTPYYGNAVLGYDPVNDVFLLNMSQNSAAPYYIYSWALKVSGTSITVGSQQQIFGQGGGQKSKLMYNASLGRFIVTNPRLTGTTSRLYSATISGTVITASAQTTDLAFADPAGFIAAADGSLLLDKASNGILYKITVDPANSYKPIATLLQLTGVLTTSSTAIGTGGLYAISSNIGGAQAVTTQGFTTLTRYVGIATQTVTTGQPVKVAVVGGGGIAPVFSGLTTATNYYYTNAGTLIAQGTSGGAVGAGFAISASTLLQ